MFDVHLSKQPRMAPGNEIIPGLIEILPDEKVEGFSCASGCTGLAGVRRK